MKKLVVFIAGMANIHSIFCINDNRILSRLPY